MYIMAAMALVLSIIAIVMAYFSWQRGKADIEGFADNFEAGWDIGFDAALTMVDSHLQKEPVNIEVTGLMRAKRAAMYQ
jgi:hypothetical protein